MPKGLSPVTSAEAAGRKVSAEIQAQSVPAPDPIAVIDRLRIFEVRGLAVVLDSDLAAVYGVSTGNFNKAVRRNRDRFRLPT